jgi:hypothetical protein
MLDNWLYNVRANLELVDNNAGPGAAIVVSGSKTDSQYWEKQYQSHRRDVFRKDGSTHIISVYEATMKGNFLGMLNAWAHAKRHMKQNGLSFPDVGLMSMVFGQGTRLSPFTQTMGNRKPAFVTPRKSNFSNDYLSAADISNLYTNTLVQHFRESGFQGLVLKWGDEAIIPGPKWDSSRVDYRDVDAIRFIWLTDMTETLAREKEWIEIDAQTGRMAYQYTRQDAGLLGKRLYRLAERKRRAGVNLGSFAISYKFLDLALEIFEEDVIDERKWVSWDPYVWIALFCRDESQWEAEKEIERQTGLTGIQTLESLFPDFYPKIAALRENLEAENGHRFTVPTMDFGELLYIDMGLHWPLREFLLAMTTDSEMGVVTRELFGIRAKRDNNGNILINSQLPESATIQNSVIVDSTVLDDESVIIHGCVIGGKHKRLTMPNGGSALFCMVDHLTFAGANGIAYRLIGHNIVIPEGGRRTTLLTPDGMVDMVTDESVTSYGNSNYNQPILGNKLSFREAGELMSKIEAQELADQWEFWLA